MSRALAFCLVFIGVSETMLPSFAAAERLPVRRYTAADGLASDRVRRILIDSRGLLWFATHDGLSSFDGHTFRSYGAAHGLVPALLTDIIESRAGAFWIATDGGGVYRFDPLRHASEARAAVNGDPRLKVRYTRFALGNRPQTNRVNALIEDRTGVLWAGTDDGLYRMGPTDSAFQRIDLGPSVPPQQPVQISAFAHDDTGVLWIGTSIGLMRRDRAGNIALMGSPAPEGTSHVHALALDHQGRLWAGIQNGLAVLQTAAESGSAVAHTRPTQHLTDGAMLLLPRAPNEMCRYAVHGPNGDAAVLSVRVTTGGRVWIGLPGAVALFDGQRVRRLGPEEGIPDERYSAIEEDRGGNLWLGSYSHGVVRVAGSGFSTHLIDGGIGDPRITSIFENARGELYVTSAAWTINRFDGRKFVTFRPALPSSLSSSSTARAYQDRQGDWWMTTSSGLHRFRGDGGAETLSRRKPTAVYTSRDGLAGDDVVRVFEDRSGDLWIATRGRETLTRWDRNTGAFHVYSARAGLPEFDPPTAFAEDSQGSLWIGYGNSGLFRHREGRFTAFDREQGARTAAVLTLYVDGSGRLWVGTAHNGLVRVDEPAIDLPAVSATYTSAHGLSNDTILSLTEGSPGQMYIGTMAGVDRLDVLSGGVVHYTASHGLAGGAVEVAYRDRRGWLWFGCWRGLSRLIAEPPLANVPPSILIGSVTAGGSTVPVAEFGETHVPDLRLGTDPRVLEIAYFGVTGNVGEPLRYQYRLEGADSSWSEPTDERRVRYVRLAPGSYRFAVRAVTENGLGSSVPATVTFFVAAPIWRRWWFLLLIGISLAAVVYAAAQYRMQAWLELERVRARIATDLHDDIGASLSRMAILAEVVKRQVEPAADQSITARMLTDIADSARELVDSMSDIVWSIDPRRDNLESVTRRVRQFASTMLEAKGINWRFDAPPAAPRLKLSPEQRRHLLLFYKEAINNIARHADCRSAVFTLEVAGAHLVAGARDDGRGLENRPTPRARSGFGLRSLEARATQLGGVLLVSSAPGEGTELRLTMPINHEAA